MAEIIYAKYNKLRRKEFRICTVICEWNSERWVEKRPLCPEAQAHVDRMAELGPKLKKVYPKIDFAEATKIEAGVRFPYLTGTTVDSLLAQKARTAKDLKKGFTAIFEWILPADRSAGLVNIDCNLDNFLVEDGRVVCLDYEWVVERKVSVDFLRYRVIHYYYGTHPETNRLIAEKDLMAEFGLEEADQIFFEAVEIQFQEYVFGEGENARYTDGYRRSIISLESLVSQLERKRRENAKQKHEIGELRKVVAHYSQVEGKLRKIGLWQLMQGIQKIGRKIKRIIKR